MKIDFSNIDPTDNCLSLLSQSSSITLRVALCQRYFTWITLQAYSLFHSIISTLFQWLLLKERRWCFWAAWDSQIFLTLFLNYNWGSIGSWIETSYILWLLSFIVSSDSKIVCNRKERNKLKTIFMNCFFTVQVHSSLRIVILVLSSKLRSVDNRIIYAKWASIFIFWVFLLLCRLLFIIYHSTHRVYS